MVVDSNMLQSVRTSCDRCRFHKLRCLRSSSSGSTPNELFHPCERCARAQAPCVFGRRRRACASKRQSTASNNMLSESAPEVVSTSSNQAIDTNPATSPAFVQLSAPSPSTPVVSPRSLQRRHTSDNVYWEHENTLICMDDVSQEHLRDLTGICGPAQQELIWTENFNIDVDFLDSSSWLSTHITPELPVTDIGSTTVVNNLSHGVPEQRLVALIASMQQCLQTLEHGHWTTDPSDNLDDYPVGTVLHLSQEFDATATLLLCNSMMVGGGSGRDPSLVTNASKEWDVYANTGIDTVTTLLVLGGYMSLSRIYRVVVGQFQAHLSKLSSTNNAECQIKNVHSAHASPTLQLGELPSTGAAPILGKIHTALRMLLAALHGVEDKLGPGGTVARNLVVALLAQEAVAGNGQFQLGDLSNKMQSMQEVLQEKMSI